MARRNTDYENYLFSQGKTFKEVRKLGADLGAHSSNSNSKDTKSISKKVICDYCNKPVSQVYYNTHLVTDKHLENVEKSLQTASTAANEKKKEKIQKEKEKQKEKKKKPVKENDSKTIRQEEKEEENLKESETEEEEEEEQIVESTTDTESD